MSREDRIAGAMVGLACGDALGAPYEFLEPALGADEVARFDGGRPRFGYGTWTDDTAMAAAILYGADDADLGTAGGLDAVAGQFVRWLVEDGRGIGQQTFRVLSKTVMRKGSESMGELMTSLAAAYQQRNPDSAGNGALMRTAAVAVTCLDDRNELARRARLVAALTHLHHDAADSAVLWTEAVRLAITEERLDVAAGLDLLPADRRALWQERIDDAVAGPPGRFVPNGWTVTALQAAWSAIVHTPEGPGQYAEGVQNAIRIGSDTDTIAAIAGGLLGARWGASAVPVEWRAVVHGWPGKTCGELGSLAVEVARNGGTE